MRGTGTSVSANAAMTRCSRSTSCARGNSLPGGFLRKTIPRPRSADETWDCSARPGTVESVVGRRIPAADRAETGPARPRRNGAQAGPAPAPPSPPSVAPCHRRCLRGPTQEQNPKGSFRRLVRVRSWISLVRSRRHRTPRRMLNSRNRSATDERGSTTPRALSRRLDDPDPMRATHVAHRPRARRADSQPAAPDGQRGRHRRTRGSSARAGRGGHRIRFHRALLAGQATDAVAPGRRLRPLPEGAAGRRDRRMGRRRIRYCSRPDSAPHDRSTYRS